MGARFGSTPGTVGGMGVVPSTTAMPKAAPSAAPGGGGGGGSAPSASGGGGGGSAGGGGGGIGVGGWMDILGSVMEATLGEINSRRQQALKQKALKEQKRQARLREASRTSRNLQNLALVLARITSGGKV